MLLGLADAADGLSLEWEDAAALAEMGQRPPWDGPFLWPLDRYPTGGDRV